MNRTEPAPAPLRRFAEVVETHMADGDDRLIERRHAVGNPEKLTEQEIYQALHGIVQQHQLPAGSYVFRVGVEGVF